MKKHLWPYLLIIGYCLILLGCSPLNKILLNNKNSNTTNTAGTIDSFLVSMDEYRIIDTQLNDKIDSILQSAKENTILHSSDFPFFITIKSFERQDYTLFAFGLSKAYILEFISTNEQPYDEYSSLVSDPGYGVLFYKDHLVKLGGLPETYRFIDQNGKERQLVEATGRKLSFYAYTINSNAGARVIDLTIARKYYYKFQDGNFFFHVSTD